MNGKLKRPEQWQKSIFWVCITPYMKNILWTKIIFDRGYVASNCKLDVLGINILSDIFYLGRDVEYNQTRKHYFRVINLFLKTNKLFLYQKSHLGVSCGPSNTIFFPFWARTFRRCVFTLTTLKIATRTLLSTTFESKKLLSHGKVTFSFLVLYSVVYWVYTRTAEWNFE